MSHGILNSMGLKDTGVERRILPRYSFSYLTFKLLHHGEQVKAMTFEVNDVSVEGLALETKFFDLQNFKMGDFIHGVLNWAGERIDIKANIQWIKQGRFGIRFVPSKNLNERIRELTSIKLLTNKLKFLHLESEKMTLPQGLCYWIQSEGPLEFFAWKTKSTEVIHRLQIIYWQNYLEWEKGQGWSTGVLQDRHQYGANGPMDSSECVVLFDSTLDQRKLKTMKDILSHFPDGAFAKSDQEFLLRKLMLSF